MNIDQVLDCSGLPCSESIIKASNAIDKLKVGQVLELISTEPATMSDIYIWSIKTGHQVLESENIDGKFIYLIKKIR